MVIGIHDIRIMSDEIETRISKLPTDKEFLNSSIEEKEAFTKKADEIEQRKIELKNKIEERKALLDKVANAEPGDGSGVRYIASITNGKVATQEELRMMNNGQLNSDLTKNVNGDIELRSLKNFLTGGERTQEERSALVTSGASAVMPKTVMNELITDTKYSNLLSRATVLNEQHRGETSIPIASNTSASWKVEGAAQEPENASLSSIKLYGYELMRLMSISSATDSMSAPQFKELLLSLISEEVIETLEYSFISGTGLEQAQGLDALELTNATVTATGEIKAEDIALAISKLPQKYARNAIILANTKTLYNLSLLISSNDNTMGTGANSFLKKEIVPNEHMKDNEIYVVDPQQLYVKFAQRLAIEADRSSGFRSATIDLRALAVVDAKWNAKAVAKVVLGA